MLDNLIKTVFSQCDDMEILTQFEKQRDLKFLINHLNSNEHMINGITGQIKQRDVIVLLTNLQVIILKKRPLRTPLIRQFSHDALVRLNSSSGIAFTRIELATDHQTFVINAVNNDKAYQFITRVNQLIAALENNRIIAAHIDQQHTPDFFETELARLTRLHDHGIINDLDFENSRANLYYIYRQQNN